MPGGRSGGRGARRGGRQARTGLRGRRAGLRLPPREGRCPDDARAEGFFGAVKEELCCGRNWSRTGPEEFAEEPGGHLPRCADGCL